MPYVLFLQGLINLNCIAELCHTLNGEMEVMAGEDKAGGVDLPGDVILIMMCTVFMGPHHREVICQGIPQEAVDPTLGDHQTVTFPNIMIRVPLQTHHRAMKKHQQG